MAPTRDAAQASPNVAFGDVAEGSASAADALHQVSVELPLGGHGVVAVGQSNSATCRSRHVIAA